MLTTNSDGFGGILEPPNGSGFAGMLLPLDHGEGPKGVFPPMMGGITKDLMPPKVDPNLVKGSVDA